MAILVVRKAHFLYPPEEYYIRIQRSGEHSKNHASSSLETRLSILIIGIDAVAIGGFAEDGRQGGAAVYDGQDVSVVGHRELPSAQGMRPLRHCAEHKFSVGQQELLRTCFHLRLW